MARPGGALALLAGLGALYLLSRGSNAATVYADGSTEIPVADLSGGDPQVVADDGSAGDSWDAPSPDMSTGVDPVESFISAIVASEHNALDVASGDAYRTFYGGAKFSDLSNHPVLTGELKGVPLSRETCLAAGIASGVCVSTAAGGLQFTVPTWRDFGYGLTFSPEDQREAGRRILDHDGVTPKILAGDITGAIALASKRWASLPGSTARQGGRTLAFVMQHFNDAQAAQGLA